MEQFTLTLLQAVHIIKKIGAYGDPNDNAGNSIENPIEGDFVDPGDRRFVMNTGPFTLAPSDSRK